jgi:hypothetical protein
VSGPCLSSSVAGRPLRPATRQSLGGPLPRQQADRPRAHQEAHCCFGLGTMSFPATCGINSPFGELSPTSRQIAHVLRTRSPLEQPRIATELFPFDLHVLSTPPAFVLSQDQTLRGKFCRRPFGGGGFRHSLFPSGVRHRGRGMVVKSHLRNRRKNALFSILLKVSCCYQKRSGFCRADKTRVRLSRNVARSGSCENRCLASEMLDLDRLRDCCPRELFSRHECYFVWDCQNTRPAKNVNSFFQFF